MDIRGGSEPMEPRRFFRATFEISVSRTAAAGCRPGGDEPSRSSKIPAAVCPAFAGAGPGAKPGCRRSASLGHRDRRPQRREEPGQPGRLARKETGEPGFELVERPGDDDVEPGRPDLERAPAETQVFLDARLRQERADAAGKGERQRTHGKGICRPCGRYSSSPRQGLLFEDEDALPGPGQFGRGHEPAESRPDHHHVVHAGPIITKSTRKKNVHLPFPDYPLEAVRGLSSQIPWWRGDPRSGGTARTGSRGRGARGYPRAKPERGTS